MRTILKEKMDLFDKAKPVDAVVVSDDVAQELSGSKMGTGITKQGYYCQS